MAPVEDTQDIDQLHVQDLISLEKASAISELSHGDLALLIRKGELWGVKIGRNWVTTEKAIQVYLRKGLRPGPKTNEKTS